MYAVLVFTLYAAICVADKNLDTFLSAQVLFVAFLYAKVAAIIAGCVIFVVVDFFL